VLGRDVPPQGLKTSMKTHELTAINPATGEVAGRYTMHDHRQVERILEDASRAQSDWSTVPMRQRCAHLVAAAAVLRNRSEEFARLMADEMGKPLSQGLAEVEKCAWVCEYYAENAERFLSDESVPTDASESLVAYRPLGVVLAVMPWNFPFWQVFRFAAPNLVAGNGGILKHASNVPGCGLAIEEVFSEAGFPGDVFRTLLIGSRMVGDVIKHPIVRAVTLTGSTPAGRSVAATAGAALKKTVLELGGSDPYIILEDADLSSAVRACADSRLINSGQSCIAAKRFIVPEGIRDAFESEFVKYMDSKTVGNPTDVTVDVGPQARVDLRDELHRQVLESVAAGARVLLGCTIPSGPGAFYPPSVLTDVRSGMPAYGDELFGPVAAVIPVRSESEAIRVANDSVFGLGAAVFTGDVARGRRIARDELHAGSCFVNTFVRSDPRLPFGGVKDSGYGRELADAGIREFVNVKTVFVA
jgi:succinate-semialdehyde dehydrogenase/glutarate-semialdehyde dehydrogenase